MAMRGFKLGGGRKNGPETHNHQNVEVRLMLGDCLQRMQEIPAASVDMVMCDLPYGTTRCEWDSVIPLEPLWAEYRRVTKENAAIVLTASQPFTTVLAASNLEMFRYEWIWDKVNRATGRQNASRMPMKRHENVLVFYRRLPTYNRQMRKGKPYSGFKRGVDKHLGRTGLTDHWLVNRGERNPISIVPVPADNKNEVGWHPTQKPTALMAYFIKTYTNLGETVLDNTMGSGSTGVACLRTGRAFIGIERDPDFYRDACERLGVRPED